MYFQDGAHSADNSKVGYGSMSRQTDRFRHHIIKFYNKKKIHAISLMDEPKVLVLAETTAVAGYCWSRAGRKRFGGVGMVAVTLNFQIYLSFTAIDSRCKTT